MSVNKFFGLPLSSGEWSRAEGSRWWYRDTGSLCELVPVIAGGTTAAFTQTRGRFRNDDGNETTATWIAAENVTVPIRPDQPFRLRIQVDETAGGTSANFVAQLRYSHNGGAYTVVDAASSVVRPVASGNLADEAATTAQLTAATGTFLTGAFDEANGSAGTTQIDFAAGQYTEVEYSLQLQAGDVAQNDTVDFRVYRSTNALNAYTVSPRLLVSEPVENPAGTLTFTGLAPVASVGFFLAMAAGALTFTGHAPTVSIGSDPPVEIAIPAGTLNLTGRYVDVAFTGPDKGHVAFTGYAPTVLNGPLIQIPAGSLVYSGQTLTPAYGIDVPAGSLVFTGYAPTVQETAGGESIQIPAGALTFTGQSPSPLIDQPIAIPAGSLVYTGRAPTLDETRPIPAGSLVFTGLAPGVSAGQLVDLPAGSLVFTGLAPNPAFEFTIPIPAGSLVFTGLAPTVASSFAIDIPAGSLRFTGLAPSLEYSYTVPIASGSLVFTGYATSISGGTTIEPQAGSLVFTGQAPTLSTGVVRDIPAGSLVFTGIAPNAQFDFTIAIPAGAIVFNGLAPDVAGILDAAITELVGTHVTSTGLIGTSVASTALVGVLE